MEKSSATSTPPKTRKRSQTYLQGLKAERWAGWLLRAKGYTIIARRFKARGGEIDLIAKREKTLIFVEVKFRQSLEEALYSITPRNQARIIAASEAYLASNPCEDIETFRFDSLVFAPALFWVPQYQHLENAFEVF
ncbi:MAG: YraN family protein [Cohaesibacter sp.]|jgi:putative endonuclease|nr:YraN family protein [Cohaesibacter sp.]